MATDRGAQAKASGRDAPPYGFGASIAIEDGRLLAGELPPRQTKLIVAWIELHREELFADWEIVLSGEEPFRIAPLQ